MIKQDILPVEYDMKNGHHSRILKTLSEHLYFRENNPNTFAGVCLQCYQCNHTFLSLKTAVFQDVSVLWDILIESSRRIN